jgi:hypothetical protein
MDGEALALSLPEKSVSQNRWRHTGMDARNFALRMGFALVALLSCGANYRTQNFLVTASNPAVAKKVGDQAEGYRKQLALYWLGRELPTWQDICPIEVIAGPNREANGVTNFVFMQGTVGRWQMRVEGTEDRVLDSVLPHEITHTILASHFAPMGMPVPRWADEGACTTVEHISERSKFDKLLIRYLHGGQGFSFQDLYHIKDYPADPLPLYAQGYSVVSFLVAQGGPQKFVNYLQTGMSSGDWAQATEKYYQYQGLGHLKKNWLAWVADGGGDVSNYAAIPETKDLLVTAASTPLSELTAPTAVTVASASAIERTWVSKELGISGGVRPIRQFQPTNAPRDASTASAKTIIR